MAEVIPQGSVKILNISDIKWDKRYRTDMGDLDALAESIREKGILQPITVDTDFKLLAGERRITAAGIAGLTKIPALVRKTSGEIDAREVELFENILRKDFSWDEEARLIRDIDALYKAKDMEWSGRKTAQLLDKGVATVARAIQLANAIDVIPELGEMKTADDALKTIKGMEEEAIVTELRARQVSGLKDPENKSLKWGIGDALKIAEANYRIGDTFKGLAELRSNGSIDFIECDPPYGIDLTQVKSSKDSVGSNVTTYNEISKDKYPHFLTTLAKELYRVAGNNCWLVFWFGPTWHHEVITSLKDAGWQVDDIPCIWQKNQGQTLQPELYLGRCYEPFFIARKGKPVIMKRGRLNVFVHAGTSGSSKYHPTERPVALIEDILETFCIPSQVCLVPFLGSGATLRACYNQGLKAFGWDKSGEYKDKFMLKVEEDSRKLLSNGESEE